MIFTMRKGRGGSTTNYGTDVNQDKGMRYEYWYLGVGTIFRKGR